MNKGKNCFFAILVFGLTMAVFNGMSVVLAGSSPERGFTGQQDLPTLPHRESFREQME